MDIQFRKLVPTPVVETALVQRTLNRTLDVHEGWPFVIWCGPPGNGKTTTARHFVTELDRAYAGDPEHGFRAVHFEVAQDSGGPSAAKRFLRAVHNSVIGRLTDGDARSMDAADLAKQIVEGIQHKDVQMLLIDEAGLLSVHALRGLCLLRTEAENAGWQLSVVLIGMDELPSVVKRSPQVRRRVHEWCYFEPYSFDDTWDFVAAIHPHFRGLARSDEEHAAQVRFLHEDLRGLPGAIVPFLQKLDATQRACALPIDLTLLRAVHQVTSGDELRAFAEWKNRWRGPAAPSVESARPETDRARQKKRGKPKEAKKAQKPDIAPETPKQCTASPSTDRDAGTDTDAATRRPSGRQGRGKS